MKNADYIIEIAGIYKSAIELVRKKSNDYADDDNPFANFTDSAEFVDIPVYKSILTRYADKMRRIKNILLRGKKAMVMETIEDTILDAINYLAITLVWLRHNPPAGVQDVQPSEAVEAEPVSADPGNWYHRLFTK